MNPNIVVRPDRGESPRRLNKALIASKFKASSNQDVDSGYQSDEEKDTTMDFEKENLSKDLPGIDLMFLIDTTGSMAPFMKSIKELSRTIIKDAEKYSTQFTSSKNAIKVAVVAYRDHGDEEQKGSYLTKVLDFSDPYQAKNFLNNLTAKGGYDKAEAVFDGLEATTKLKWRQGSAKYLYHILDGPPHGNKYSNDVNYPDGCPCGVVDEDILYVLRDDILIKYHVIKFNDEVDDFITKLNEFLAVETLYLKIAYDQNVSTTQKY